jgi:hypothetical protein
MLLTSSLAGLASGYSPSHANQFVNGNSAENLVWVAPLAPSAFQHKYFSSFLHH